MGIFSRFSDIINSNVNAMLDGAENPEKMIRLIVREMEETLVEVRSSCARMIADRKTLQRRHDGLSQEAAEWEAKASLAISKGREDLARAALVEKKALQKDLVSLDKELVAVDEQLTTLSEEVAQLQAKLDDAKAKQKALLLRGEAVTHRKNIKTQISRKAVDDAFGKFELFERRLDEMEGHVEAMDVGRRDLRTEIDKLAEDEDVSAELQRLKASVQHSSSQHNKDA